MAYTYGIMNKESGREVLEACVRGKELAWVKGSCELQLQTLVREGYDPRYLRIVSWSRELSEAESYALMFPTAKEHDA